MKVWSIIKAVFHVSMAYIGEKAKAMWATVGPYVTKAWSVLKALGNVVGSVFGGIAGAVIGALSRLANWIANSWIGKAVGYAAGGIGSALSSGFNSAYAWSQGVNSRYDVVPPAKSQTTVVHTTIKMGTRTIADAVTKHQSNGMSRPNSRTTGYDSSRQPLRVGQGH